ncbi:MAG: hypothetical protein KAJ51_10130 [Thermoplasmata archaeon]|nr:hypothetical protein [Thermoplasmata archaeon]
MDVSFYAILFIGLPFIGVIINLITIQGFLEPAIEKLKTEDSNWEEKIPRINRQINVFRMQPVIGLIFGALTFELYFTTGYELPSNIEDKILMAAGLAVGCSALFMSLGMAIFYKEAIPSVVADERTFGKNLIISNIPMTSAIYGLLITILLYSGIGVIGGDPIKNISEAEATNIFNVFFIFSILSASSILNGYLPTIVKGNLESVDLKTQEKSKQAKPLKSDQSDIPADPVFSKKMIFATVAETPKIIGLLIVIITFVEIGIL